MISSERGEFLLVDNRGERVSSKDTSVPIELSHNFLVDIPYSVLLNVQRTEELFDERWESIDDYPGLFFARRPQTNRNVGGKYNPENHEIELYTDGFFEQIKKKEAGIDIDEAFLHELTHAEDSSTVYMKYHAAWSKLILGLYAATGLVLKSDVDTRHMDPFTSFLAFIPYIILLNSLSSVLQYRFDPLERRAYKIGRELAQNPQNQNIIQLSPLPG